MHDIVSQLYKDAQWVCMHMPGIMACLMELPPTWHMADGISCHVQ